MKTSRHDTVGVKFLLLLVLTFSLCMPICDLADHHSSSATHPSLCTIDMPQAFQLLVLMNALFLAVLTGIVVLPAPIFTLLKPPRHVPLQLTSR